jgi:hypothetical protein
MFRSGSDDAFAEQVDVLKDNIPDLLRWSKFGGEELSRVVDRCLAPGSSPKVSITTLIGLNNALGRFKPDNISQGITSREGLKQKALTLGN